ncbi:MAG: DUF4013 domain-containing protein [Chloroflexota bacterium]|jgi:hypothetical protein
MEIGKAFTFVNEDEAWIKKLVIGAVFVLLSFLLVPILPVVGYQIRIIRNVIDGRDRPLPEWDGIGQMFMDGLMVIVAGFIYALPMILISACAGIVSTATADAAGNMSGLGVVITIASGCLGLLYGIALAVIIPAVYIQYARVGEFGAMFRVAEVIAIARENLANFIIVLVVYLVASFVVSLVSVIAVITICGPIIVSFVGTAWVMYAQGHLYGQIARKMSDKAMASNFSPA